MKKNLLFYLAMLQVIYASSQNSLKGTVKDKLTGEKIPAATIYLADLKLGVTTDSSGSYELKSLPKGKFLVECKLVGFNTPVKTVVITGETRLDFEVEQSAVEMQEVTVTGSSQSTELKENPISMAVIGQASLFENTASNLIDNITKTPGVNQLSTGAGISKPVIRGLGFNRIVTLNNNIRQEGQQWGDEHGIEIDEFSVDRVEIIKGPGSLMYGSDAIAGVVNFLSPYPLPIGQIKAGLLANYQTNNSMQAYSFYNAGNLKGINWMVRGTAKKAGNYHNAYDGYVHNSGFKEYDANGYLGINKSWGYTHFGFSSFNQMVAMTEGDRDSLGNFVKEVKINDTLAEIQTVDPAYLKGYYIDLPKQVLSHNRITSNTRLYFNRSSVTLNLGYQQNTRKEFGNVLNPGEAELYFLLNTINYDLRYQLPELKGWHVSLGLNGMKQDNSNQGEEVIIPEYSFFDAGAYLFTKKNFGKKFSLSGGIRFDDRHTVTQALYTDTLDEFTSSMNEFTTEKFAGIDKHYQAASGSLGFTYEFNEQFSVKVNAARGFRAPNISEISSNGKHEGTLRYERGDPDLKPETSLQADLGFIINANHITAELSLFYNDIQNYIFARKLESVFDGDSIADPADPAPVFKYAQEHAVLYGGEFSLDIHPHPLDWLHIENSFSLVEGLQNDKSIIWNNLPFMPAPRYQGELRTEFKKAGKFINAPYFAVNVNYFLPQDKVYSDFGTETKTPDYGLLNLSAGANIINRKGSTLFTLSLSANNVLDVAYQNHLSRLKYAPENIANGRAGVFNMGRNFSFKILIPLVLKK
jgi:iron complex outermembrane recepter protein